ncbi:MAG: FAD-binding oxidoreductase [Rhodobacter sp.]|uniref:styrene monooxygenase/indole monooxygenase family protein n=1 Tax=Pararhodobacter sp. TaxID=2127056 RepID=UPI001DDDA387|nr:styrene monooxygenase/indole monooxygenase family protein [Pararhodobacter sp.]MCB1344381.1 FAD-binding oxidoreductase [Paracoccaceae bacterium]MCC0074628.1 FAD-binding oxidoreductase [Rhodobacter sp.]HPD93439.1 FAD-binding oxidoreductase [Pararhodobacter sp.]
MRKITIVGGGQSGFQLAIGLLQNGYQVRVVQNRDADDIARGKVLSSQCMFGDAIQAERDLGLDYWSDTCPPVEGISFVVPHPEQPGAKAIDWAGRLERNAYSVDQRVKIPRWMAEFERLGGRLVLKEAGISDMELYAREDDLVIVASGKGEIGQMFERDAEKSPYDRPQRALALTYVDGMTPRPGFSAVNFNLIPGVGEYFVFPALTTTGPCDIMVFEGVPGGPMDCWSNVHSPEQHLETSLKILNTYLPWEAERCRSVSLTDDNGILAGRFPPTVRKPIGSLPSGARVLGLGDAVCLNDPITGQGSNNAAKAARVYLKRILDHGDRPFDAAWMQGTFDAYWDYAQWVVNWTNMMLAPPPPFILEIMGTACAEPRLAHRIANGFDDPRDFFPWFADPGAAQAYLAELRAA